MARYFECPIQCSSAAFDVLIKISESYRPQIPSVLHVLNLSQTKVSTLPYSIGTLKLLKLLDLSQTKIYVLLESIRVLKTLKTLDLSQTRISILQDAIGAVINLAWLSLSQKKSIKS